MAVIREVRPEISLSISDQCVTMPVIISPTSASSLLSQTLLIVLSLSSISSTDNNYMNNYNKYLDSINSNTRANDYSSKSETPRGNNC